MKKQLLTLILSMFMGASTAVFAEHHENGDEHMSNSDDAIVDNDADDSDDENSNGDADDSDEDSDDDADDTETADTVAPMITDSVDQV